MTPETQYWLVVSTHLKNISQIGSFPQVGVKIKIIWNHHLVKQVHRLANRDSPRYNTPIAFS